MNAYELIRSGRVRRWHANPDLAHTGETNGHHQWAVASLILALHPAPYLELVQEALWHDAGEMIAGDLPLPFKDRRPDLAAQHAEAEAQARAAICRVVPLPVRDLDWLIFCDRLAAWLWMAETMPRLMDRHDWSAALDRLWADADRLGCLRALQDLIAPYGERSAA